MLIVGADPEGSVYTAKADDDLHPYLVEGIGKDTWPETMDPKVVDEWVRVRDRESFRWARRLAREEGILAGGSGGTSVYAAVQIAERLGPGKRVLTMIPDSGRNYLSKFYDDNWMLEHGFIERQAPLPTVDEVLRAKHGGELPALVTIAAHQKVGEGIDTMQRYGISQLPVVRDGECESLADVIGSLQDRALLERVFTNPDVLHEDVANAMQPPLGAVEASATLDEVFATLTGGTNAVVVARDGKPVGVLTRSRPARVPRAPPLKRLRRALGAARAVPLRAVAELARRDQRLPRASSSSSATSSSRSCSTRARAARCFASAGSSTCAASSNESCGERLVRLVGLGAGERGERAERAGGTRARSPDRCRRASSSTVVDLRRHERAPTRRAARRGSAGRPRRGSLSRPSSKRSSTSVTRASVPTSRTPSSSA